MVKHVVVLSRPGDWSAVFFERLRSALASAENETTAEMPDFIMLDDAFLGLIRNAERNLDIMAPFQTGINNEVLSEILNAVDMGTALRIITRVQEKPEDSVFGLGELETCTRYFEPPNIGDGRGSLHAKVMIRDREEAYFGSGELMDTSLSLNLEVGLMTDDPRIVAKLCAVFDIAWDLAH